MGNALQKISGIEIWGAVKSENEQQLEEEDELPLTLPAMVKSHFDTLVCAQLCNPQGVALFSFVRLPPHLPRPFAGAAVYDMSLTHAERLRVVGCGFKGNLVRLLSLGMNCTATSTAATTTTTTTATTATITRTTTTVTTTAHQTSYVEPHSSWRACHGMMQSCVRRVASKPMAAVRDDAAKEAEELCASGQCAAAAVPLQRAIHFGDSNSRALKAWLLIHGREGVAKDHKRAFELAEEGARLGCHHCQGVLARCYLDGCGCEADEARSLELARESSGRGSRYGQYMMGWLHYRGIGGFVPDYAQSVAFYGLAAAQGLDEAQCNLGHMYRNGDFVAEDHAEALRLYQLAAAQGHPFALYRVAFYHENGLGGVAADAAEAIRWYMRAQAAGFNPHAAAELRRLRA